MNALEKLRQVVDEIKANTDPMKLQANWDLAARLVARFPIDQEKASEAYRSKDFETFDALVRSVENPPKKEERTEKVEITHEMREAMKAFRKRLKLTRLDDESRLGTNKLTGGKQSQIDAIIPPREYPDKVWKDLARAGALRYTGQGFYELVEGGSL